MIASHRSVEKGHRAILDYLGLEPILDLRMRLGEGTGAALAMNIIEASCKILNEMATFESAGVSQKDGG
jgi:nicotinate-nucleotide--dimethylbenzimidazole phosphoribosyltransferase